MRYRTVTVRSAKEIKERIGDIAQAGAYDRVAPVPVADSMPVECARLIGIGAIGEDLFFAWEWTDDDVEAYRIEQEEKQARAEGRCCPAPANPSHRR